MNLRQKNCYLIKSCLLQLNKQLRHLAFMFNLVMRNFLPQRGIFCHSEEFNCQSDKFNSQSDEFIRQSDTFNCQWDEFNRKIDKFNCKATNSIAKTCILVLITVRISATLPEKDSLCVHCVMRGVIFGTIETLVMLHTYYSCLIMVLQSSLLPSWPFGVRP